METKWKVEGQIAAELILILSRMRQAGIFLLHADFSEGAGTMPNWLVSSTFYGHWLPEWDNDPFKIRTDVYYLLGDVQNTPR